MTSSQAAAPWPANQREAKVLDACSRALGKACTKGWPEGWQRAISVVTGVVRSKTGSQRKPHGLTR